MTCLFSGFARTILIRMCYVIDSGSNTNSAGMIDLMGLKANIPHKDLYFDLLVINLFPRRS